MRKKNIMETVDMRTVFDEMWYMVQYFFINIIYFFIFFLEETQDKINIYTSFLNSK